MPAAVLLKKKKLLLGKIYRLTVEQNKVLQEELLDDTLLESLENIIRQKQQHMDEIDKLDEKLKSIRGSCSPVQTESMHEEINSLLKKIRELDILNSKLALKHQEKLKAKIDELQQNKKGALAYHSSGGRLREGAFIDSKK